MSGDGSQWWDYKITATFVGWTTRHWQAVDKVRQRRSRGAQRLNVQRRVRFASSLAAALLDGLSEQPAAYGEIIGDLLRVECRSA
jgi:hypothetical protein